MSNIELTIDGLTELFTGSTENILQFFTNWCDTNRDEKVFDGVTVDVKKFLADKMDESLLVPELTDILLVTIRILCRDKRGVDSLLQPKICEKVLKFAGLPISEDVKFTETSRMEAQKCLVNTMFNSAVMPRLFYSHKENTAHLMSYLTDFEPSRRSASKMEWIRDFSEEKVPEAWFLYAKIAFIATAKSGDYQQKLAQVPDMVDALVVPISMVIPPKSREREMTPMDIMTANEALRTFFNIYCHFEGVVPTLTGPNAATASRVLRDIICSSDFSPHDQISQSAIHALAVPPLPIVLRVLCSDPEKELPEEGKEGEKVEYTDMRFTEAMLRHAEHRMDLIFRLITEEHPSENPSEAIALLGPYFQVLTRMCMESKYVRRYCRMKILPPLTAEEVQKRPEDNDNYRGKLAKMMTMATSTKDIIGQFIYVICKRNVSRMIKYVGFGHCAGHLANFGLLGQLNQPKRASDSEDSETDDYNAVRDSDNLQCESCDWCSVPAGPGLGARLDEPRAEGVRSDEVGGGHRSNDGSGDRETGDDRGGRKST